MRCGNKSHKYLDLSSQSTKGRQKRFYRTGSKQITSLSQQKKNFSPFSKFYVKNIMKEKSHQQLEKIINQSLDSRPQKINNPAQLKYTKPNIESGDKQIKEQRSFENEIKLLKNQIKKSHQYLLKQSQISKIEANQRQKILKDLRIAQKKLQNQQSENLSLKKENEQLKKRLINQEDSLRNIQKSLINLQKREAQKANSRIQECQQKIDQLNSQILQLKVKLSSYQKKEQDLISLDKRLQVHIQNNYEVQENMNQFHRQIQHLKIRHNLELRKVHMHMQSMKQQKEEQYWELKKKFSEYLEKFKGRFKNSKSFPLSQQKIIKRENSDHSLNFSSNDDPQQFF